MKKRWCRTVGESRVMSHCHLGTSQHLSHTIAISLKKK